MKLVGLNKLLVPVAVVAVALFLTACGNTKYAKQTHGGSASANNLTVTTKPKIDIVVFQDNSDSTLRNGPIEVLKPQMYGFLGNLSGQWDYRFTVMPLLTTMPLSYKYVVASDCNGVSGVLGCLSPSQIDTFNRATEDYGWINNVSFQGGDDRGFANIKANLQNMGGFLRSDAALAVIVVSNGDDLEGVGLKYDSGGHLYRDYSSSSAQVSFNSYRSYFQTIKGSAGAGILSKFFSVAVPGIGLGCMNGYSGQRYNQMANDLGGRAYDLCGGQLNSSLDMIKQQLVAITQSIKFDHVVISERQPVVSSIRVWKNGVEIPQGGPNGWTYVGYQNRPTSYFPTSGNYRSGYMIQLSGSARFQGSDQITFDFDPL
jgi:hypothetical protein